MLTPHLSFTTSSLWKHNASCESYLSDISNNFKVHLLPSPSFSPFLSDAHTNSSFHTLLSSLVNLIASAVKAAGICYFVLFGIAASSHLIQIVSLGSLWHTGAQVAKELSQRCPHKGFLLQTSGVWYTEQRFPSVFWMYIAVGGDPIAAPGSVEFYQKPSLVTKWQLEI